MRIDDLKWDERGLVTVVVQDVYTGEIRMLAHANRDAVELTLRTGEAHFFSRSRNAMWKKGETSGNSIAVYEVHADCDGDALIYLGRATGPSCHTGEATCFFTKLELDGEGRAETARPTLLSLEYELEARRSASGEKSYTRSLLDAGPPKIGAKIREEADELARAIEGESDERVASEMGDLLYHAMVGLLFRRVPLADVMRVLRGRFGRSGHEEKASRKG
ncbi:MAG: bifunctional phosphoribosyl-AMP cyclohydrolase/phosphoribosyl-ATP diphosphatase HisIE [Myxococcales bacterium]|nr:bifunctional phosphoribosyl-AMP cyclohydrolase/phosphoribosyl-ATP diphosphatase HisIE [Myxococcales bacterium]